MNILACKLSGNIINLEEHFYICTGSGSNGKSQFFKLLNETFGNYYFPMNNKLMKIKIRNNTTPQNNTIEQLMRVCYNKSVELNNDIISGIEWFNEQNHSFRIDVIENKEHDVFYLGYKFKETKDDVPKEAHNEEAI